MLYSATTSRTTPPDGPDLSGPSVFEVVRVAWVERDASDNSPLPDVSGEDGLTDLERQRVERAARRRRQDERVALWKFRLAYPVLPRPQQPRSVAWRRQKPPQRRRAVRR